MRTVKYIVAMLCLICHGYAIAVPSVANTSITVPELKSTAVVSPPSTNLTTNGKVLTLDLFNASYSDLSGSPLAKVKIEAIPNTRGLLFLDGVVQSLTPTISVADISAGKLVWLPHVDNSEPGELKFRVTNILGQSSGTVNKVTISTTPVNDPPKIQIELIKNGNFLSVDNTVTPPMPTDWTRNNASIAYAYGGLAFNAGNVNPPTGISSQQIKTEAGVQYNLEYTTIFGGFFTSAQNVLIEVIDVASNNLVTSVLVGQAKNGALPFKALGTDTLIKLTDRSTVHVNTDIAFKRISVTELVKQATLDEDATFIWSQANRNVPQVSDIDIAPGSTAQFSLALAVTNGTLSLSTTTGLTFNSGANNSAAMTITGTLNQINAALEGMKYTPTANYHGSAQLSMTVDDKGNIGPGEPLTATANVPITILPINDPPSGTDKTISLDEDTSYNFASTDFGFTDPSDPLDGHTFKAVTISSLPTNGTFTFNGAPVSIGQVISVADIPLLKWTPAPNANGLGIASFTFQVQDSGGTLKAGEIDSDPTPNTITFNVQAVNDLPAGADKTIGLSEDGSHTFNSADFSFSDPLDPSSSFKAVVINSLPNNGVLTLNGIPVVAGQAIPAADIPLLKWTPAPDANGNGLANFQFQVQDNDGGLSPAKTITFNVNAMNDPPADEAQEVNAVAGESLVLNLLPKKTDADGDLLSVSKINGVAITPGVAQTIHVDNGVVKVNLDGTFIFIANPGFSGGNVTFNYEITDGKLFGNGIVKLKVTRPIPVNNPTFLLLTGLLLMGLAFKKQNGFHKKI